MDAETALILYRDDANDEYDLTEAGKNGLLIGYGYRVYIEEDVVSVEDTPKFHFYDVLSGRTVSMENPYPDSRPSILSGNRENAAAVSFDNGHICLFSYDTETLREVPVVYRAQEVTDFCFSDDDRYLLVITANGHLDIFETATMERKFNETVEELTALVSGNREYDELTGEKNFISSIDARIDPDDAVLYVSVGTSVEQRGLAVNTDTWLVDQILLKEDISGISPLPAVKNNRIYQFPNSYQTEFYSCPIYSTTDLKAWAEKELREK